MVTLKNDKLTVLIAELGAEIKSIKSSDGIEYIWQGGITDRERTAPIIFPIIGRLRDDYYTHEGASYGMGMHGLLRQTVFERVEQSEAYAKFCIKSTENTKKQYPFDFMFTVEYTLVDDTLTVHYDVLNTGDVDMYYSVGAHLGFNVPFTKSGNFDQYYLEFDEECTPNGYTVTDDGFITGEKGPFGLIFDKILPLAGQEIFVPTVLLEGMSKGVTLKCNRTRRKIRLRYDDFKYLALWHEDKGEYICIEPWTGTPDKIGDGREIKGKNEMTVLKPNELHGYSFSISIN